MEVASRWSMPVGLVRWCDPRPLLTVIVKATFRLDGPQPGVLTEVQEPLFEGSCGAGDDDEPELPSDFAPRKARADVLLAGHAHAAQPSERIAVAIDVAGMHKHLYATAGAPATQIPLSSAYLRGEAEEARVRVGARPVSVQGWVLRCLPERFDFGRFNVAPGDQQLARLSSSAAISLVGLVPGAPRLDLVLPGLEPAVFVLRPRGGECEPVPLVCDTLWIHGTRGLCTLCWRGTAVGVAPDACLLLAAGYGAAPSWAAVRAEMSAMRARQAIEEGGAISSRSRGDGDDGEATLARGSEPGSSRPGVATLAMAPEQTLSLADAEVEVAAAPTTVRRPAGRLGEETLSLVEAEEKFGAMRSAALPFRPAPVAPAVPAPVAPPPGSSPERGGTEPPSADRVEPPSTDRVEPPSAGRVEPPSAGRVEPLALDRYADIKVALLRGQPLDRVLARYGLDEVAWRLEERRRVDALSLAAQRGDLSPVQSLRRAMREAQQRAEASDRR